MVVDTTVDVLPAKWTDRSPGDDTIDLWGSLSGIRPLSSSTACWRRRHGGAAAWWSCEERPVSARAPWSRPSPRAVLAGCCGERVIRWCRPGRWRRSSTSPNRSAESCARRWPTRTATGSFPRFSACCGPEGGPWVAVLEDVQWADEATLELLRVVGRRAAQLRALVVATFRDDEVGPDHPLSAALGDIPAASMVSLCLRHRCR